MAAASDRGDDLLADAIVLEVRMALRHEHVWEDGKGYGPGRFFSIRSDEGLREVLGRYGAVEEWMTWDDDRVMHYQWAVLRVSAS